MAEKIRDSYSKKFENTNPTIPDANKRLIERYVLHYKSKRDSQDITIKNLKYNLLRLMKILGKSKFESTTSEEIFDFIEQSDNSIDGKNRMLIVSNMLFKYLRKTDDVFQKKIKSSHKHKINFIIEEELKKYLSKEENEIVKSYVHFLFYTGLRVGELKGLNDSDFNDNYIQIERQFTRYTGEQETKNNKNRAVLLLPGVLDCWKTIKDNQQSHTEISRLIRSSMVKQIERDISAHDLRHSFAIHLRAKKFMKVSTLPDDK